MGFESIRVWFRDRGESASTQVESVILDPHDALRVDALLFTRGDEYLVTASRAGVLKKWALPSGVSSGPSNSRGFPLLSISGLSENGRFRLVLELANSGARTTEDSVQRAPERFLAVVESNNG